MALSPPPGAMMQPPSTFLPAISGACLDCGGIVRSKHDRQHDCVGMLACRFGTFRWLKHHGDQIAAVFVGSGIVIDGAGSVGTVGEQLFPSVRPHLPRPGRSLRYASSANRAAGRSRRSSWRFPARFQPPTPLWSA